MSTLMAEHPAWQKYAPKIHKDILKKQDKQEEKQDKMIDSVEKSMEEPRTQNNYTLELVQNKETNIGTNYGPNIENNGTLSLPDKKDE